MNPYLRTSAPPLPAPPSEPTPFVYVRALVRRRPASVPIRSVALWEDPAVPVSPLMAATSLWQGVDDFACVTADPDALYLHLTALVGPVLVWAVGESRGMAEHRFEWRSHHVLRLINETLGGVGSREWKRLYGEADIHVWPENR